MRCPECNKWLKRKAVLKGICKCGYKIKLKDYFKPNWQCPLFDMCNYVEVCDDNDWEKCGTYLHLKKFFTPDVIPHDIKPVVKDLPKPEPLKSEGDIISGGW